MISSVLTAVIEPWNMESVIVPDKDTHESFQDSCFDGERVGRDPAMVFLIVSWTAVRNTRVLKSTRVAVDAVAASEIREVLIPADLATCSSVSPLWRNSDERSVRAGTEARLRPVFVCLISTVPLWRRRFWLSFNRSRSVFRLNYAQVDMNATRAKITIRMKRTVLVLNFVSMMLLTDWTDVAYHE